MWHSVTGWLASRHGKGIKQNLASKLTFLGEEEKKQKKICSYLDIKQKVTSLQLFFVFY